MNQEKIGKFIAECRKENGFTQTALAEKLGITDRAVSKWENGKSLPDPSIMLELCALLEITVNELLTGEKVNMESYRERAEKNLIELAEQEKLNNKKLLDLENVIGFISSTSFIIMISASLFSVSAPIWRIALIAAGIITFIIGIYHSIKLEQSAGYYECPNCRSRYVPSMREVITAPHILKDRRLKCPYCNQRGYHKKVLTK